MLLVGNMTVRECLLEFLTHVAELEEEDPDGDGEDRFTLQFQALKDKSIKYRSEKTFTSAEGEKDINRRKNRYKDILPFDHSRVVLKKLSTVPGSDYINANFIKGAGGRDSYIAAQGPLPATVDDFWRMIWEYQVQVIVMVCSEMEDGKPKCQRYWPPLKETATYGSITVCLEDEVDSHSEFVMRVMRVSQEQETKSVRHFHFKEWPDHGVTSAKPILNMIGLVRESQPQETPPIVVHCSAGCGRTGSICAIDYAWSILKLGKLTPKFSMYDVIASMRTQRPSIVQARDQYILVNRAVEELFRHHLEVIDQNDYENVDLDGKLSPSQTTQVYQNMNFAREDDYVCVDYASQDPSIPPVVPRRPPTKSQDASVNQVNLKNKNKAQVPPKKLDSSPTDSKAPGNPGVKPSHTAKPVSPGGNLDKPKPPPNKPKRSSSEDTPPSIQDRLQAFQNRSENSKEQAALYSVVEKKTTKGWTMPATYQNIKTSSELLNQGAEPKAHTLPSGSNQHVTQIKLSPENAVSKARVGYSNDDDDHSVFVDNTLYSPAGSQTCNDYSLEQVVLKQHDSGLNVALYSKEQAVPGGVTHKVQGKSASPVQFRYETKRSDKPYVDSEYSNPFELPERSSAEYALPYDIKDSKVTRSEEMYASADAGQVDKAHTCTALPDNKYSYADSQPVQKSSQEASNRGGQMVAPPRTKKKKGISDSDQAYEEVGAGNGIDQKDDTYDEVRWRNGVSRQKASGTDAEGESGSPTIKASHRLSDPHPDFMEKTGNTLGRWKKKMFGDNNKLQVAGGNRSAEQLKGLNLAFPARLSKPLGPRRNHLDPNWPPK